MPVVCSVFHFLKILNLVNAIQIKVLTNQKYSLGQFIESPVCEHSLVILGHVFNC